MTRLGTGSEEAVIGEAEGPVARTGWAGAPVEKDKLGGGLQLGGRPQGVTLPAAGCNSSMGLNMRIADAPTRLELGQGGQAAEAAYPRIAERQDGEAVASRQGLHAVGPGVDGFDRYREAWRYPVEPAGQHGCMSACH